MGSGSGSALRRAEAREHARGTVLGGCAHRVGTAEVALQPDEALQPGLYGIDGLVHVGAVQQQSGLQAERVSRAEAARGCAGVHEGAPECGCGLREHARPC